MYVIEFGGLEGKPLLKYRYLVGPDTVGIITPTRQRHMFKIEEVTGRPANTRNGPNDGTVDSRCSPVEVAAFVLARDLR